MKYSVLIVNIGKVAGGIEKYVFNVYQKLNKNILGIDFLVYNSQCAYESILKKYSNVYHITSRKDNPIINYIELKSFFKKHKYDVIWIQTSSASYITAHILAKRYSTNRLITHAHVVKAESKGKFYDLFTSILHYIHQNKLNQITDVALACSRQAGEYLFGKKHLQNVTVVFNGINLAEYQISEKIKLRYRDELGISEDCIVVGHVGRFSLVKNHDFLIELFKRYHKQYPNSRLLLVGDGEERRRIEEKVQLYNLKEDVIFTGERADVAELIAIMNVFVFPSLNEGFGIAAIEAQAAGIPTIINDELSELLVVSDYCKKLSLNTELSEWIAEINNLLNIIS